MTTTRFDLSIISNLPITVDSIKTLAKILQEEHLPIPSEEQCSMRISCKNELSKDTIQSIKNLAQQVSWDIGFIPAGKSLSDFKLLAMDMDSTLITIECIDEIAKQVGKGDEVSAITAASMRGELPNFEASLRARCKLLAGSPVSVLDYVWTHTLRLTPGAERLIAEAHKAGLRTLLVSGGFTFFTDLLQAQLGLSYTCANELTSNQNTLTGEVTGADRLDGRIVDAQAKKDTIESVCKELQCNFDQVIAIGDGANDLIMLNAVGMGVAHHAKPAVRQSVNSTIDNGGLDRIIDWLQIK